MTASSTNNSRCPLCNGTNQCAMSLPAAERPAQCWCVNQTFPATLTAKAPNNQQCICQACLATFTSEHQQRQGEEGLGVGSIKAR